MRPEYERKIIQIIFSVKVSFIEKLTNCSLHSFHIFLPKSSLTAIHTNTLKFINLLNIHNNPYTKQYPLMFYSRVDSKTNFFEFRIFEFFFHLLCDEMKVVKRPPTADSLTEIARTPVKASKHNELSFIPSIHLNKNIEDNRKKI